MLTFSVVLTTSSDFQTLTINIFYALYVAMLDGQLENLLLLGFWVTFSLLQADLSDLIYHLLDLYHFLFYFSDEIKLLFTESI